MEPLDLFIKFFDKLIQLLGIKAESKRKFFNEIIEPLFNEVEIVIENYFKVFKGFKKQLSEVNDDSDINKVILKFRKNSEKKLVVRRKVMHLAVVLLEQSKEERLKSFLATFLNLFYEEDISIQKLDEMSTDFFEIRTTRLRTLSLSTLFNKGVPDLFFSDRDSVIKKIDSSITSLEHDWISFVQAYGQLRLHYLK